MRTIIKIILSIIVLFTSTTATNLFAQDNYESYNDRYESPGNSLAELPTDWLLPSDQLIFPMRDDSFEEFNQQSNNWLQLLVGSPPTSPGGRPGDMGAQGGIGHTPVGDGTSCLLIIVGLYICLLVYTRIRKHQV